LGLLVGFEVAQSTVSKYMMRSRMKYMMRSRMPPSQSWKTFLRNHAEAIAAIDMCVVPTLTFERLFAFLVLGHGRRLRGDTASDSRMAGPADHRGRFPGPRCQPIWCATTTAPLDMSSRLG